MPFAGFAGGLLIGLAAATMLLGVGRVAGVSGLAARAAGLSREGSPWPVAATFLLGLPFGAFLVASVLGAVTMRFPEAPGMLMAAGLLVGIGTRLGSGCTSGHAVCGLSRLAPRSIAATATFLTAGFATVATMRLVGELS